MKSMEERFWARVDKRGPDECWEWMTKKRKGYGIFYDDGKHIRAHRVAWELTQGESNEGKSVLQRCRNRACVNPSHLYLVDGENSNRAKGTRRRIECLDRAAAEKRLAGIMGRIRSIAARMAWRSGSQHGITVDDLAQIGAMGAWMEAPWAETSARDADDYLVRSAKKAMLDAFRRPDRKLRLDRDLDCSAIDSAPDSRCVDRADAALTLGWLEKAYDRVVSERVKGVHPKLREETRVALVAMFLQDGVSTFVEFLDATEGGSRESVRHRLTEIKRIYRRLEAA